MRARRSKFGAKRTVYNGISFHSLKEARRYGQLLLLERAGTIRNLELQPKFEISINGIKCFSYSADFAYFEGENRVVEDVKSEFTRKLPEYRIKKKCVEAAYSIKILET